MKNISRLLLMLAILILISCNKADNNKALENILLNYDSLLVKEAINVTPEIQVAHLNDWVIDENASQDKEDMIFFQNIEHAGMITVKVYNDGKIKDYLQEIIPTFEGKELLSQREFTFENIIYHQFMIRSEDYIVLKVIVEINERSYVDTNILVLEDKYQEISYMIETYLASIAILN